MKKDDAPPSLFEMMRTLTAQQRQRFGEFRRKLRADSKVKEEIVWDKKMEHWYVRYMKGKKEVTSVRFLEQKLVIGK